MNEDYKVTLHSPELERRDKEIQSIVLTDQEIRVAHENGEYQAKVYKWQLLRRGNNDSMKAVSNDLKKD